jgi:hypothetical protein
VNFLSFALMLGIVLCASAATITNTISLHVVPDPRLPLGKGSLDWVRLVSAAFKQPFIQWGNDIYDLRATKDYFMAGNDTHAGFYLAAGRVISVATDGLIVEEFASKRIIFLFRARQGGVAVDGDYVASLTRPRERYQYRNALGALRTIEAYDCGELPEERYVAELQKKATENAIAQAEINQRIAASIAREADAKAKAAKEAAAAREFPVFLKRAQDGDAAAQFEVGLRLLLGRGVEANKAAAIDWLEKAAGQGNSKAKDKLKELKGSP